MRTIWMSWPLILRNGPRTNHGSFGIADSSCERAGFASHERVHGLACWYRTDSQVGRHVLNTRTALSLLLGLVRHKEHIQWCLALAMRLLDG